MQEYGYLILFWPKSLLHRARLWGSREPGGTSLSVDTRQWEQSGFPREKGQIWSFQKPSGKYPWIWWLLIMLLYCMFMLLLLLMYVNNINKTSCWFCVPWALVLVESSSTFVLFYFISKMAYCMRECFAEEFPIFVVAFVWDYMSKIYTKLPIILKSIQKNDCSGVSRDTTRRPRATLKELKRSTAQMGEAFIAQDLHKVGRMASRKLLLGEKPW